MGLGRPGPRVLFCCPSAPRRGGCVLPGCVGAATPWTSFYSCPQVGAGCVPLSRLFVVVRGHLACRRVPVRRACVIFFLFAVYAVLSGAGLCCASWETHRLFLFHVGFTRRPHSICMVACFVLLWHIVGTPPHIPPSL